MNISKNQFSALIFSNLLCWVFVLFFMLSNSTEENKEKVLSVERINVVNEDGTTVMAISNKQNIAAPRMNGKEYPVDMIEREHFAGIIFFNEKGDEVGGLIFNSGEFPDGSKYGSGHLSFDRFNDNQVIKLDYKENIHGLVQSGLTIYDRTGDGSFGKNLDLMHEYKYDSISQERRKEIINEINEMKGKGKLGSERLFLGSTNTEPQLTMKDEFGKEKVKLFINDSGIAKLQFFNDNGHLIEEYPNSKQ